jgi:hypothetical protein
MKAIEYQSGQIINGLVFIKEELPHISPSRKSRKASFKCKCGKKFTAFIGSVVSGNTKSCGCWGSKSRSIRFTKHGLRSHPLYNIWSGIKTRCYNKNRHDYKYYGGCGVVLSDEFHDFNTWFNYVISLPEYENREIKKLTIDRINVNKNYERGNLRWATKLQQSTNQRRNSSV